MAQLHLPSLIMYDCCILTKWKIISTCFCYQNLSLYSYIFIDIGLNSRRALLGLNRSSRSYKSIPYRICYCIPPWQLSVNKYLYLLFLIIGFLIYRISSYVKLKSQSFFTPIAPIALDI